MAKKKPNNKAGKNYAFFYYRYPRYREIQCYLRMLARTFPKRVRIEKIGTTIQGRDIDMIVIGANMRRPKNGVMIDAGIHAREWLANSSALYFIDHLIRHPHLTKCMDFYVIPCLNPDGYEYTHTADRLWRKNMNTNGSTCIKSYGVDLNRNFPHMFGKVPGSSKCPGSFMYRGQHALSEPESRGLANTLTKYRQYIKLYISLHCYGNLIMFPWGHTKNNLPDARDLIDCGCAAKNAMKDCGRDRKFKVGSVASLMYLSTGCTVDYARGCHNIKFAYTVELQKGGKSGFTPSPKKIVEIGEEVVCGISAMAKYVNKYYRKRMKTACEKVKK